MSYHEGSNWQARKEDEGKPLYGSKIPPHIVDKIKEKADVWNDDIKPHIARGAVIGYLLSEAEIEKLSAEAEQSLLLYNNQTATIVKLQAENERMKKALESIRYGFDHENDAHKYQNLGACPVCIAASALKTTP